jgi:hypothetical protein
MTTHPLTMKPVVTIIRHPDDETIVIEVNGEEVARANYDFYGWFGMDAVEHIVIALVRAFGGENR